MTHIKQARLSKIKTINALKFIFIIVFSLIESNAYASMESYHIEYHKDSEIKNPPLTNIEILIQFHRNGNSLGNLETKTNDDQEIQIDNTYGSNLVIHVLSIKNNGKRIRCWGVSTPKTNTIEIKCQQ